MTPAPKTLLIFCDGSGEDGNLTNWNGWPGRTAPQNATNVLRLSRAVRQYTSGNDCKQQLVLYMSGVGSEADFEGNLVGSIQLLAGTAVASKIRDAYAFLAQNFNEGDELTESSRFSRGAYTVRKLAGLIDRIGLLTRENLGNLFTIWSQLVRHQTPTIPPDTRKTRIKCVGVWDTVGAILNTVDALGIEDTSLPPTVDIALHAVSLQDNRDKFLPTLWQIPPDGLSENQILKQVWFPGAHSDVGGGYKRQDLSDLALFWMVGEIMSFIDVDTDLITKTIRPKVDPWGASQPHNAYHLLTPRAKRMVRPMPRLHTPYGQIIRDALFHESLRVAPTCLEHPEHMVTLKSLKDHFGESWEPSYIPLNEFERRCKDSWVSSGTYPSIDEGDLTAPFKSLSDLLSSWTSETVISSTIALRSYDGRYMKVSTDEGSLAFHDRHVDDNAKFALINLANGKISLKGPNGKLLHMPHSSNHVMCIGSEGGVEFEVVHLGANCVALTISAHHEVGARTKFLSSGVGKEPYSGSLVVTDDMDGPSCCFVVEILDY